MSAPTYDIATVRDFLAVPEDRIDACLRDFATFLRTAPHWAALMGHVSDKVNGPGLVEFAVADRFRWIDDADHAMSFTVLTPDDAAAISRNLDRLSPEVSP